MPQSPSQPDVVIVGAGIVGLATALALLAREPGLRIRVLERSGQSASGQSGHNSGVIHSGIYYAPASLKARLCREGRTRLLEFCEEAGVEYRLCGKILVATNAAEGERLRKLHQRGQENGLKGLRWLEADQIASVEPEITGFCALQVPEAGVVDFAAVCVALQARLQSSGVEFCFDDPLLGAQASVDGVQVRSRSGACSSARLIACAGLYADEVARRCGLPIRARIVPFRGEYRVLADSAARRVRALVYPVPDPALPFLGVHLTRDIHDTVDAGPNAVLALAREGYTRGDIDLGHLFRLATWPGAWRLAWRQRHYVGGEMIRSLSKRETARALRRMLPVLRDEELLPGGSGVRAQLVDPDGSLVDDFRFAGEGSMLHVLNAPSPAATASLAIGEMIAERALG
ncbi:L-2-hydroxyglutarate oxidase [bacterium]|nr:MAG: L-2-hydroxyglutarate oxidase [bacterium]